MSKTCERCNGSGIIKRLEHDVFGNNLVQVSCPVCNGSGKIEEDAYPYKELYTVMRVILFQHGIMLPVQH